MRDIGKGIAIAGIWIGVGIAAISVTGKAIIGVAVAAAVATVLGLLAWD